MYRSSLPWLWMALALSGCRDNAAPPRDRDRDRGPPRRVIDPPGTVRPLPPYAISDTGVGPYQLGVSLATVLSELPSGPRMVVLDVPGLIKQNVIRAEDDGVLVSGPVLGDAAVIAVVNKDVARTESGISVGSQRVDLENELRTPIDSTLARDPRLLVPRHLPSARLLVRDGRVDAVILTAKSQIVEVRKPDARPPGGKAAANSRDLRSSKDAKTLAPGGLRCPAAIPSASESGDWFPACLSPAGEIVRINSDEVSVRSGPDGKERILTQLRARGLVFAAPLRSDERPGDRDDLIVVTSNALPVDRSWTVAIYRFEAGRLVRLVEDVVYRLSADGARWIGVSLDEVEIYLELVAGDESVAVGGFFVTTIAGRIRDVVSLRDVSFSRRRNAVSADELPAGAGRREMDKDLAADAELVGPMDAAVNAVDGTRDAGP
jgi:hypothetical protein